jgi:cobalt/nickel transport system permease protein
MGLYHALIGIIEGLVTFVAIKLIAEARPDVVKSVTGVAA